MEKNINPPHPGDVLLNELLIPRGLSQNGLAKGINVSPRRVNEIVLGKRSVSADTALRLARFFGTTPEFWLHLQLRFELESARAKIGSAIEDIKPLG